MNGNDEDDDLMLTLLLGYTYWDILHAQEEKDPRNFWVHTILSKRKQHGEYYHLVSELSLDSDKFENYFRLNQQQFDELEQLVGPLIAKNELQLRETISPRQRLAITLRFLATGDSYKSLEYSYRVSNSLISRFVPEVCEKIWEFLRPIYVKTPKTKALMIGSSLLRILKQLTTTHTASGQLMVSMFVCERRQIMGPISTITKDIFSLFLWL